MDDNAETWVSGVKFLAGFVIAFPQMAYEGLTMLLKKEWQFFQIVTPVVWSLFAQPEAT